MKFKIGDRVAVYFYRGRFTGEIDRLSIRDKTKFFVQFDSGLAKWVHPKQCRRLKPKRKAREFWVEPYINMLGSSSCSNMKVSTYEREDYIHVCEVLPKSGKGDGK